MYSCWFKVEVAAKLQIKAKNTKKKPTKKKLPSFQCFTQKRRHRHEWAAVEQEGSKGEREEESGGEEGEEEELLLDEWLDASLATNK